MASSTIASLTPTVCGLFQIPPPTLSAEPALDDIRQDARAVLGGTPIDRCLVYCPDALGEHLWSRYAAQAETIGAVCPQRVHLASMHPPKTPVCYASVFSGAPPEIHGIRHYERPVLAIDTLFDALIRAGRRAAIVAVKDSSIDVIFRGRALDYFSEEYDAQAQERALALLAANEHDLIVVYHQEYDDQLHRTEPFSAECLAAMRRHVASLQALAAAARTAWRARPHAIVVAPDHGAHLDPATGRGDHGLDIPEDMEVSHWYGVFRGES